MIRARGVTLRTTTELTDNACDPLQAQTSLDTRLIDTFDVPPYVNSADQSGAVPFLDIANRYILAGAQYNPQVLACWLRPEDPLASKTTVEPGGPGHRRDPPRSSSRPSTRCPCTTRRPHSRPRAYPTAEAPASLRARSPGREGHRRHRLRVRPQAHRSP